MKIVVSLIIVAFTVSAFGQTLNFNMGRPFSEFRKLELDLHSQFRATTSEHMLAADMAQPIKYLRISDKFDPKPVVGYFFKASDSTVQEISYEWDKQNFRERNYQMTDKDVETEESLNRFVAKYNELKNEIRILLGDSKSEGSLEPKTGLNYLHVDMRDSWENDSISVLMYISFSNKYEARGNVTITPTHRIRVYVKAKRDIHVDPSDQLKAVFKADEMQQKVAEKYIALVLSKKFKESWELISPDVKSKATFEAYLKVLEQVDGFRGDFKDKTELALSGPAFFNNEVYYTYSFKFNADTNSPPSVLLDVTFKVGESLITGFRPKKLDAKLN
jgi:hypothetical protein